MKQQGQKASKGDINTSSAPAYSEVDDFYLYLYDEEDTTSNQG
jgi:hypothetical protein